MGKQDRVTGGLGELLHPGSDIDRVANQGELQLAAGTDRARNNCAGVDPDADPKCSAESLGDKTMYTHGSVHCGFGVIGQIVRGAVNGQRAVTEELVDVPTGLNHSRHNNFKEAR